jgi:hypothetical protein
VKPIAMKLIYFRSKRFLTDLSLFVLTFILGLLFGWIVFGAITSMLINSLLMAAFLEFMFRFAFKKTKSPD